MKKIYSGIAVAAALLIALPAWSGDSHHYNQHIRKLNKHLKYDHDYNNGYSRYKKRYYRNRYYASPVYSTFSYYPSRSRFSYRYCD